MNYSDILCISIAALQLMIKPVLPPYCSVPSLLSRGMGRDGIGTGFSKWDGIVPSLPNEQGSANKVKHEYERKKLE